MFSYLSYFNEVSVPREWRKGNEEYTIPNMRWVPRTGIYRIEDVVCLQYEIGSQEMKKKDWGRYCSRHEVGSQGGKEKAYYLKHVMSSQEEEEKMSEKW